MLYSTLLIATLVSVTFAATTPPVDPTFPTERGVKCQHPGDSPPRCPTGFFCPWKSPSPDYCYQQLSLDMPCYREWKDCASPNYCRKNFRSKAPGKCTAPGVEGATCYGQFGEVCAQHLACITPEGNSDTSGRCASLPRKTGEACNTNSHCSKSDYCQVKAKNVYAGVCTRRAQLKEDCADNERYPMVAAPCADSLGCFITTEGGKGTCYPNHGDIDTKCSLYGGLYCKQGLFCKYENDSYYGACQKVRQLGDKCIYKFKHEVPCASGLSCYFEDNDMDGVCRNMYNNPVGAKCTDFNTFCVNGVSCKMAPGKRYGVCASK
jgi:hypothetical protein